MVRNQSIICVAFNNRSELVDKADGEFMRFSLSSDDVIVLNTKDVRVSVSVFCIVIIDVVLFYCHVVFVCAFMC